MSSCTRYTILPSYPTINSHVQEHLLLTNIGILDLNEQQLERRSIYGYYQHSNKQPENNHEHLIISLSRLWNINRDILEYNFEKLMKYIKLLAANRMHLFSIRADREYLPEHEYTCALEFFLQIDIHVFFMKTCSFRGAESLLHRHGSLFSDDIERPIRYRIQSCQQVFCCLCFPSYRVIERRQQQPVLDFQSTGQHHFVNGYKSILNCPAQCSTQNIIYVLTCPCRQVDYVGETSLSLATRLTYHQAHGNRIIQEFLLGKQNVAYIRPDPKSNESLVKDSMKLYRHSTQCSYALQWFLDENPDYWVFVPTKITTDIEQKQHSSVKTQEFIFANRVPMPPKNYEFTYKQKLAIERYFHEKKYLNSPNLQLDLFHADIVAVLPNNASDVLRRFIEALFITQTESKLNTTGHLDCFITRSDYSHSQQCHDDIDWCSQLRRRVHFD